MTIPRKLTANFVETRVDDEILIVDLDGGELLSLGGTGRAVWELIDGERSVTDIASALGEAYDAEQAVLTRDVEVLLAELEKAALVALD
ncbi:PqqD family protein [Qipengyuania flava]|uniref:PqqD family protein n=1 Tax=Qipengyuania flava TaxID=192812 RepID=UPI001C6280EF|nr:PqqD family protein [Qipengyuania flava]QYJ07391.1 PqqD family protein [Qipengyuania flava]